MPRIYRKPPVALYGLHRSRRSAAPVGTDAASAAESPGAKLQSPGLPAKTKIWLEGRVKALAPEMSFLTTLSTAAIGLDPAAALCRELLIVIHALHQSYPVLYPAMLPIAKEAYNFFLSPAASNKGSLEYMYGIHRLRYIDARAARIPSRLSLGGETSQGLFILLRRGELLEKLVAAANMAFSCLNVHPEIIAAWETDPAVAPNARALVRARANLLRNLRSHLIKSCIEIPDKFDTELRAALALPATYSSEAKQF